MESIGASDPVTCSWEAGWLMVRRGCFSLRTGGCGCVHLPGGVMAEIYCHIPVPRIPRLGWYRDVTVDLSHYSPRQMDTTTTSCPQGKATPSNHEPSSLPTAGHRI
eukprot:TRINITY_DN103579_c0_g1_i1.p1 TRINITY_DN103579_c0_g1~~TRINITY_DN103579_c0_g1_i1.p1  ORF type:complete len:106 (-),score=12.95 TRINITY_DN103579_c0_g1_i1:349-666(-)